MGLASLQVCMDSSDWLQGTMHEESSGIDSSSSPSGGDILTCSRPMAMVERRLRPPHDQGLIKCPRCDSTHTKFCYYNNYSLSQPRYFCKTCRRYWTKGGTLRNIPVGGGCRKNNTKKLSSKRKPIEHHLPAGAPTDLHLNNLLGAHHFLNNNNNNNFMDNNNVDFMDNHFHGMWSPFGTSNIGTGFMDSYQQSVADVKPKLLSLEWQDQQQQLQAECSDHIGNDSFGYLSSGMGSWAGMINSNGSS